MLCRSCNRSKCYSLSTEAAPIEIECPECDGVGCNACHDGVFVLDGCPNSYCSSVVGSLELFDLFTDGIPPVAGGALDQSVSFLAASRFFRNEEAKVRNDRISRNSD